MLAATTLLQWVSLGVVAVGVLGMVVALRLQSRITRDGVIFLFAVAMFIRGVVEARTDLFYAGLAATSAPFALRKIDEAKDREQA